MRQFDVVRNTGRSRTDTPYWVIVQSSAFGDYDRRVAIPLVVESRLPKRQRHVNPAFDVEGRTLYLNALNIASLPMQAFGEVVASLSDQADDIIAAIDWVISRAFD
ncbi:MAG: CcdB family protein [Caenispirillum bisanense]|nr:CcdB family protein [Caenispirillum bisanense]